MHGLGAVDEQILASDHHEFECISDRQLVRLGQDVSDYITLVNLIPSSD